MQICSSLATRRQTSTEYYYIIILLERGKHGVLRPPPPRQASLNPHPTPVFAFQLRPSYYLRSEGHLFIGGGDKDEIFILYAEHFFIRNLNKSDSVKRSHVPLLPLYLSRAYKTIQMKQFVQRRGRRGEEAILSITYGWVDYAKLRVSPYQPSLYFSRGGGWNVFTTHSTVNSFTSRNLTSRNLGTTETPAYRWLQGDIPGLLCEYRV